MHNIQACLRLLDEKHHATMATIIASLSTAMTLTVGAATQHTLSDTCEWLGTSVSPRSTPNVGLTLPQSFQAHAVDFKLLHMQNLNDVNMQQVARCDMTGCTWATRVGPGRRWLHPLNEIPGWVDIRDGLVLIESERSPELLKLSGKVVCTLHCSRLDMKPA